MEKHVLAKVNGREITDRELASLTRNLGQNANQFRDEEGRQKLIDELIHQELLYSDALESGLDKAPDYIAAVEDMKVSLLKQYALSKLLEQDGAVSIEEAETYYNENKHLTAAHCVLTSPYLCHIQYFEDA